LISSTNINGHDDIGHNDGTQDASTSATGPPSQAVASSHHPVASKSDTVTTTATNKQQPRPPADEDDALLDRLLGDSGQDRSMTSDPAAVAAAAVATAAVKYSSDDFVDNISNHDTKESRARKSTSTNHKQGTRRFWICTGSTRHNSGRSSFTAHESGAPNASYLQ
jgi:hypothetical protein